MRRLPILAFMVALVLDCSLRRASAQPAQPAQPARPAQPTAGDASVKDTARKLAKQGFDAMRAGKYKEAAELFRRADMVFHAPTLVLQLGHAAAKAGSLLEARAAYQRVVDEELAPGAPIEFVDAQAEAQASLQALPKVDIPSQTKPTAAAPELPTKEEGPARPPPAPPALRPSPYYAPAVAAFAVGGIFAGVGLVAGALRAEKNDDIWAQCKGDICPKTLEPEIDTAKTLGRVALSGLIVGGVGVITGSILLVTRNAGGSEPEKKTTALLVGPGSLALRATF